MFRCGKFRSSWQRVGTFKALTVKCVARNILGVAYKIRLDVNVYVESDSSRLIRKIKSRVSRNSSIVLLAVHIFLH